MAYQYPSYWTKTPVTGGSLWTTLRWKVWNRTGGALAVGKIYAFDTAMSQSETTTFDWGVTGSVFRNIVNVGTTTTGTGTATPPHMYTGFYCVATDTAADNTETEVIIQGECSVYTVSTLATQYYPKWSALVPTAGKPYGTISGGASAITLKQIGRTLAAYDSISATDGQEALRSVYFNGLGQLG